MFIDMVNNADKFLDDMDCKKNMTRNQFKLFKRVIELSKADNWEEARKEWEQIAITERQSDDLGACTCGHYPIKEEIQLFNIGTKKEIIVGNCCIKKFFDIKDFDKVFMALREGRVNKFMIEDCFKKGVISSWESDFMLNVWRKRNVSAKQSAVWCRVKKKILAHYRVSPQIKRV